MALRAIGGKIFVSVQQALEHLSSQVSRSYVMTDDDLYNLGCLMEEREEETARKLRNEIERDLELDFSKEMEVVRSESFEKGCEAFREAIYKRVQELTYLDDEEKERLLDLIDSTEA